MTDKYRAYNISGEQWEHFTLEELARGAMFTTIKGTSVRCCHYDDYKWWCRWTGLQDKNGREIYEGDRIYVNECNTVHEVVWGIRICLQLCERPQGGHWPAQYLDCYGDGHLLKVIGNIHEEKPC